MPQPRRRERNMRARRAIIECAEECATDPLAVQPPPPGHSRQCEKVLALDRAVRCLERAREELAACIWAESDAAINFWIDQLRTTRAVFHERLVAYRNHYEACERCQAKIEGDSALETATQPGDS